MKNKILISRFFFLSFLCGIGLTFTSCDEPKGEKELSDSKIVSDTLRNDYAAAFQIIKNAQHTIINVIDPNSKKVMQTYILSEEVSGKYHVIGRNIQRVVTMSTTQVGMLEKLGLQDKIVGVSDSKFLCTSLKSSKIVEVGSTGDANPEIFLKANPDIIFSSGFNFRVSVLNKLKEAHLQTFLIYDWQETHPLGRAEWIKVFGLLFNKEEEADSIYEEIKSNYLKTVAVLKMAENRPKLLAGSYFGDVFNAPAGNSYMAQLFKDANIDYVYSETEGTGSLSLGLEKIITENLATEFWVNMNGSSIKEVLEQSKKFRLLKSVQEGKMFSYLENMNCFFQNSPLEPYIILQDLGKIFHPELFEDYEMKYYTKVK